MNRFHHTLNGETYIDEMDMDVGFIIETDNTANQYVYIFYLDLKTEDYGINESIKKKSAILTETVLRKIITESIRKILYN